MAVQQVGPDHVVVGIIHVKILEDSSKPKGQAFSAKINAPGFSTTLDIANGASKQFQLPGVTIGGAAANPKPCPDLPGPGTWNVNQESPGQLRIWTQFGSLVGTSAQSSNNARNLILQPVNPGADYTITTRLTFPANTATPTPLGQTAGMIVYQDDDNFIYVGRQFTTTGQSQIQFLQEVGGIDNPIAGRRSERSAEVLAQSQPIHRAGQPDDIANMALFLASDESEWITGTAMLVDGGFMARAQSFGPRSGSEWTSAVSFMGPSFQLR